ncbi:MAG: bifunctional oligoribonuclease/PAP phosphatase NrnA [Candidatus Saccharimonadales bacterium]
MIELDSINYEDTNQILSLVSSSSHILVIQADNPDADSLGSALALENILCDLGKTVSLYCGVDIPGYLRYISGWDRITKFVPNKFDLIIIVDASTMTLLEKLETTNQLSRLKTKPCIILDHHEVVDNLVPFAKATINDASRASAGEIIYILASQLKWQMSVTALECIAVSILGDTQGLSNQLASPITYKIMADIIENGVSRPKLEERRRELSKMPPSIYKYKATLIDHTNFNENGNIAWVKVGQSEINQYSPLYNPGPLIQNDMLQTTGIMVAIVFKNYDDGKTTAAIRCNPGSGIAADLAAKFGGGGHAYASGFKDTTDQGFNAIKDRCLILAEELLSKLPEVA